MDERYKCMSADKIYQQVAAYLKQSIASGELKIGDAIYSENLLCEKLGVSRTSVRKAIRLMIEENILVSRQGKGTFVKGNGGGVLHNALCLVNHYTRAMRYDVTDHYYTDIIYSTERATREHEMEFQIFSRVIRTAEEALERFSKLKFDGLLVDGTAWVAKQLELSAAAGEAPAQVAKTLVETARARALRTGRPDDITAAVLRLENGG